MGLPEGQMGNSEVGHLNIGAGSIVYQNLLKITRSIEDGSFFENPALKKAMENAAAGHTLHIMGLLSDGGVHSHMTHIKALVKMAGDYGIKNIVMHLRHQAQERLSRLLMQKMRLTSSCFRLS